MTPLDQLLIEIRACTVCSGSLPLGPRPVVQVDASSKILIVGQAPGRRVHESGIPFSDASGDRLRQWMGITADRFYDPSEVAIVPMGFCFPGTGPSGDLPPRPECAPTWREPLLALLGQVELTLVIGTYAQQWHLPGAGTSVTGVVRSWMEHWPAVVPLPHPSPRNNRWLKQNPWFEEDLVPRLRQRVTEVLGSAVDRQDGR